MNSIFNFFFLKENEEYDLSFIINIYELLLLFKLIIVIGRIISRRFIVQKRKLIGIKS